MKNLRLILIIWLFAITKGLSQDKGYVAISIGPSIPIGDFASKDPDNDKAGLAQTGAIFDISFCYKLGKQLGVSALLRGQANSTDKQVIVNELATQLPSGVTADVDTGYWSAGALMVGGYGSFPLSKKISFDSKIMFGLLTASSPSFDINLNSGGGMGWVKQESVSSSAFAYLLGVGLKFDAGKRICLLANVDYMGAKPKFENVEIVGSDGTIQTTNWEQPYATINIGIGVGYRL